MLGDGELWGCPAHLLQTSKAIATSHRRGNLGEDQKRDDEMLPFANVNENKDEGEETNATVGQILMTKCRH
ncbi:hypothetical protein MKW92_044947 [Papaver armeniacum]|nr:hypothetical protein MKW92_044947 [Papaver armeniacum]